MGFNNPDISWGELERRLSGRPHDGRLVDPLAGDGSDSPAWSRKRASYVAPDTGRRAGRVPYAELHCHSNFSFLDGASHPEELAEEAARLGLEALALTDHNGFYGVVRFAEAARAVDLPTIFGAELTLAEPGRALKRPGPADPAGRHLVILARNPRGYALLGRAISEGQLAGEKGAPRIPYERLVELGGQGTGDHWAVLTACRKGPVPAALMTDGPVAARHELARMVSDFGRSNVFVELWDHGLPMDSVRNDAMAELAAQVGVDIIATGNVHHHSVARKRLASAMAAVRARRSLDEIDGWLPPAGMHLRSGEEQAFRFRRYPGVVQRAYELGMDCAFDLSLVAPNLPPYPCPDGLDEMGYLRRLVEEGGTRRYGPRSAERVEGAWAQLDRELDLIDELGFPGYFLVVWDIVDFCRRADILCQGRGSAANSAVCFALGITNADAVSLGLLFERFLSPERDGPPDIDIDIESDRREEVIQYVYDRHGRHHTAQVANVITYRSKSAIRDMAKALGYAQGQQDAFSRQVDRWRDVLSGAIEDDTTIPLPVVELAAEIEHFPRHLGIHSGGMVMCDRPVIEVCPVEWGRMEDRSVLQWDKDDCAAAGLVKFDLLGPACCRCCTTPPISSPNITGSRSISPHCRRSRASTTCCRRPTRSAFSDRVPSPDGHPSPAQTPHVLRPRRRGGLDSAGPDPGRLSASLHPPSKRPRTRHLSPSVARECAGQDPRRAALPGAVDADRNRRRELHPADADMLRQAMGSKRSRERMDDLKARFFDGMRTNGITDDIGEQIWLKLAAFSNYGFPESHSVSFSYLVYASSWIKYHYPAAFCAALLKAQPMGFWSPHTLVGDARRHGVVVRTPDLNRSAATATLEPCEGSTGSVSVRLGFDYVRGIGRDLAEEIDAGRPFASVEDLRRRVPSLSLAHLEALATAGAFGCFGIDRRSALWAAGAMSQTSADRLPGIVTGVEAPTLPGMSPQELSHADLWATGVAPDGHPTSFIRGDLTERGVVTATDLADVASGERVLVGGVVTHRQRPATAQGTTFLNLEDETGLVNVVVSKGCWQRYRQIAKGAPALLIRGRLEKEEGVINIVADKLEPLPIGAAPASRDFR